MRIGILALTVFIFLVLALPPSASGQVMKREAPRLIKTIKASHATGETDIGLWIIPATVTHAGATTVEQGRFLVLTEPKRKLYWWRFEIGAMPPNSNLPADQFSRNCSVYLDSQRLVVFCTTLRHLLIGSSTRTYAAESEIGQLVELEFNQRVAQLRTGLDYFEKTINLRPILGADFFFEKGRADPISALELRTVKKVAEGFEITIVGAQHALATIRISPSLDLQAGAVLR